MIRRPPRSTLSSSSAASDVYERQHPPRLPDAGGRHPLRQRHVLAGLGHPAVHRAAPGRAPADAHRAHETPEHLVCRLLLEKKNHPKKGAIKTTDSTHKNTELNK